MQQSIRRLAVLLVAMPILGGCGGEKADEKKDAMDARSLEAMKNPPPGMPGAPPGAPSQSTPPGKPEGAN